MTMSNLLSGSDAGIERLTITSHKYMDCTDDPPLSTYKVQVNPEKVEYNFGYQSAGNQSTSNKGEKNQPNLTGAGQSGTVGGYVKYEKMRLTFDFHADATGLLPIPSEDKKDKAAKEKDKNKKNDKDEFTNDEGKPSIRRHLNNLYDTVYGYKKEIHGPPYLKLVWGNVFPNSSTADGKDNPAVFRAKLVECKVSIVLFSLKGEPIKAKINLVVESLMSPESRPLGNSPDLTHYYNITEGDKMTTYCNEIYGRYDSKICSAVAEYNSMADWKLQGGTKMTFPSIHLLEDKYLEDYEEVEISSISEETEEQQMRALIGDRRAKQYYKVFPNERTKKIEA